MLRKRTALLLLITLVMAAGFAAAGFNEQRTFATDALEIRNLIGEVRVEGYGGSDFQVEVQVQGSDASKDRIRLDADEGRTTVLSVVFPVDDEKRYVYPRLGSGSRTSFNLDDGENSGWMSSILDGVFGRGRIQVRGSGSGLEVWADITVRVPRGKALTVRHGVGKVFANDVEGDMELMTRAGSVKVDEATGSLLVDTGSGHVEVRHVRGELSVDTGSGHVEASEIDGRRVHVDTGSGHVELEGIRTEELHVDTGSGHVTARSVETDESNIDTGSGAVTLELDRMGTGTFKIDTGSGGIRLVLPSGASARVQAETGSGGIEIDVAGADLIRKERDEVEFRIGDGASRVILDTGSGRIQISD